MKTLAEITGQESGLVIQRSDYNGKWYAFVNNWSSWFTPQYTVLSAYQLKSIRGKLDRLGAIIDDDPNGDFADGQDYGCVCYKVIWSPKGCKSQIIYVLAPDGWC